MPTATTCPHRRWTSATVVALAAVVVTMLVPTAARAADAGAEAAFVAAANRERVAAGLPALVVADDLVAVARTHSVTMADRDDLHHNPSLTSDVADWQRVGENVGRGPDVAVVHTAFMASPAHRANVLEAAWTEVGVGVEVRGGRVWVTQVFRLPATIPATEVAATAAAPRHASGRSLAMLSRIAADDAALDAAAD